MKSYKAFLFLVLAASLCRPAVAQDERYDGWYGSLVKEYTLNPDGSMDYRYSKQLKLLSYRAFQNMYGETFVTYDPRHQELKINECYTLMANGKRVEAPKNSFNEVLPSAAAGAPAYNALREMVITHTWLERNATEFLDYTVHTAKEILPALMGNEILAEYEPVKSLEMRIRIPAGQKLFYHLYNSETKPIISTDGNFQVYTWKFNDVPAFAVDESQPGGNEIYPRLNFSNSDKRAGVFGFLTTQPAFSQEISESIRKEVNDALKENPDKFRLALKLQETVVNEVRLWPVSLKTALYQCRTPEETWNSNGGTALEKAVLLAAMMKAAGIDAEVAGITRTMVADEDIATLADLEDFAVRIRDREHGTWYLSATSLNPVNLKLNLPGRSFITLKPGEKPSVEKAESPKQLVKVIGNFVVSSDPKMTGEVSIYADGSAFPAAGMIRDKKKMKNSLSGGLIGNDTTNLKISTINNENGFQTWIAQIDKPFRKDSAFYTFSLPLSSFGIDSWTLKTLSQRRTTPCELPSLATESYSYTFTLPASLRLFTPETKTEIVNKAGSFLWEVKISEGKATVTKEIKFSERILPPARYDDLKALLDGWNNPWFRQLVFAVNHN